jgi:beta-sarcoglycan
MCLFNDKCFLFLQFLPRSLKFFGDTDLDEIYKRDGILQGFHNKPIEISGEDGGEVHLWTHEGSQPSLSVERGAINITNVEEFRVVDRKGREVFSTNTPTLGLPRGVQKLDVRVAKVNRITSAVNASLQLVSTTYVYLKGSEGTHLEGRQVVFKADQDIFLKVKINE